MRRTDIKLTLFVAVLTSLVLLLIFSCSAPDDPADNEAPTVTLTNPADGAMTPNAIDVRAEASDNVEVTKVEFYVDGVLYFTDQTAPWACYWTATVDEAGNHSFYARAHDAAGNAGTSGEVSVNCAITPPGTITDLAVTEPDVSGIATLTWTAPGDDGATGTAAEYDVRYFWAEITDENWASAVPVDGEPDPQVAGSAESFDVGDLQLSTTYHFALRTQDAAGNQSEISNCVSATTQNLFDDQVTLPVNANVNNMVVVDVDVDGNLDLVFTLNATSASVEIMYGLGDGTFEPAVAFDGGANPTAVGTSDIDKDDDLDLLAGNWAGNNSVIYDIICGPDTTIIGTDTIVTKVCDTVIVTGVSYLTTLFSGGDRTFVRPDDRYGFHDTSYFYCAEDYLRYYVSPDGSVIYCFDCIDSEHENIARYEPSWPCPIFDSLAFDSTIVRQCTWAGPVSMISTDLDNDGWEDFAIASRTANAVSLVFNSGDAAGTLINPVDTLPGGASTRGVVSGDLNADGFEDLVITGYDANRITVCLNDGTGHYQDRTNIIVNRNPSDAFLADYDNDGDLDIFFASAYLNLVSILPNLGGGQFSSESNDYQAGRGPSSVAAADLDGDGGVDIAVANRIGNNVSILVNQGQFQYYSFNTVTFDVGVAPFKIFAEDFDRDGDIDLAVLNADSDDISFLFNRTVM